MIFSNPFVILFLISTALEFLLNQALEYIDFSWRKKHGKEVPSELAEYVDEKTLEKTAAYEDAKYKFWVPKNIISTAFSLVLIFTLFYPWLFGKLWSTTPNSFVIALLFSIFASIPGAILSIPFDLYREFKIEKEFGFSKMTIGLWIADQLKGLLVMAVLGLPLLFALIFLLEHAESWWWFLLACVYVAFSLLISLIYPAFIAPLFNKFTPLEEGELKDRLTSALEKSGFKASGLFVMDASKRSGHSNAYFTGFGKSKRVVLYDTLIAQLTTDEIEAVLAHELGHYKHHHIVKKLCITIPMIFAALFFANLFISRISLYQGFGFGMGSTVPVQMKFIGIFLLTLVFGGFSELLSPLINHMSRHDEFQADAYSAKLCGSGKPLSSALVKLNKENLSELVPPKIYSVFNYSHPPLLERIRAVSEEK